MTGLVALPPAFKKSLIFKKSALYRSHLHSGGGGSGGLRMLSGRIAEESDGWASGGEYTLTQPLQIYGLVAIYASVRELAGFLPFARAPRGCGGAFYNGPDWG